MVCLAAVAVFLVYDYSSHVFPWYISAASAIALVSVYVGLGFTDIPTRNRTFAIVISLIAAAIEGVYGVLAVLRRTAPHWFDSPMPDWAIWTEAVLHGAPFTIILAMIVFLIVHHNDSDAQVVNDPYVIVRDIAEQQQEMARQMQAMSNHIERLSIPALTDDTPQIDIAADDPGRAYLDSLTAEYGNLTAAARALGVKRQTLYNRANKLKEVER
jgi:hypothetical protein